MTQSNSDLSLEREDPASMQVKIKPVIIRIDRSIPFTLTASRGNEEGFKLETWRGPKDGNGLEGKEEQSKRSSNIMEIDFSKFSKQCNFLNGLKPGENRITGEVRKERLVRTSVQADAKFGQALFVEEGQTALRFIYDEFGVEHIEFLGTVLRGFRGRRCVFNLHRNVSKNNDGSWFWFTAWLGYTRPVDSFGLTICREKFVRRSSWGSMVPC
ncbi:MAG: hypothetical protein WCQ00_03265 [bacterium]